MAGSSVHAVVRIGGSYIPGPLAVILGALKEAGCMVELAGWPEDRELPDPGTFAEHARAMGAGFRVRVEVAPDGEQFQG